jgi:hypothetical protein
MRCGADNFCVDAVRPVAAVFRLPLDLQTSGASNCQVLDVEWSPRELMRLSAKSFPSAGRSVEHTMLLAVCWPGSPAALDTYLQVLIGVRQF